MQQGVLTKTSIGFSIKEAREPNEDERKKNKNLRRVITKSELYEFSVVAIPANTGATIEQVSKYPDWIKPELKEIEIKEIEETETEIDMIPVVKLQEPVMLDELVELKEVETAEDVANDAAKVAVDLHEVKNLGRVVDLN
jgi:hypothetical protein